MRTQENIYLLSLYWSFTPIQNKVQAAYSYAKPSASFFSQIQSTSL